MFPKQFLWGASISAHQVEGKNHNQFSVWELEQATAKAAQADHLYDEFPHWDTIRAEAKKPQTYVSGNAVNHYKKFKEDFDLLKKLNMNSFRFSIEWSRIEPKEGSWNPEAIAYYKEYIEELRRRNIEPIVTLFHFTLPVWFAEKGGFEKRANVSYFVRFVEKIMREIGSKVRYVITLNEPEVYIDQAYKYQNWPPAIQGSVRLRYQVHRNLVLAHNRSVKVLRTISRRYKIGITKNSRYFYPGDSAWLSNVSARVMQYVQDDFFLRSYVKQSDFIGVNYYLSERVFGYRVHNPEDGKYSDVDWHMAPGDIEYVLERLHAKYKLPLFVTENGIADVSDEHRQWWLTETINALSRARKSGVPLIGYLHWSLLDNFEWAMGTWPRFGLAAVNYKTGERVLRSSALWFGRVIKKLRSV